MSTGYKVVRCVRDKSRYVIFRAGDRVRNLAKLVRGRAFQQAVEDLKRHLRL